MNRRLQIGFTLLEVLVAMALFSLILVLLGGLLYTTSRNLSASEQRFSANDVQRLATEAFRRQLEQSIPLTVESPNGARVAFSGSKTRMRFISALPVHTDINSQYVVTLESGRNGNSRSALFLHYEPLTPATDFVAPSGGEREKSVVLFEHVSGVEFSYFGSAEDGIKPRWHARWPSASSMPSMVRARIKFSDGNKRLLEIVAPVRSTAAVGAEQFHWGGA